MFFFSHVFFCLLYFVSGRVGAVIISRTSHIPGYQVQAGSIRHIAPKARQPRMLYAIATHMSRTVIMRVSAPLPPDRLFELDSSATEKMTMPNDTFSDNPRQNLSCATLFGAYMFFLWRYRAREVGPGGRGGAGRLPALLSYLVSC